jgi:hypothetical protein
MKKLILGLMCFLMLSAEAWSQANTQTGFIGKFTFQSFANNGANIRGTLDAFSDQTNQFFANSIAPGDVVWDNVGRRYAIVTVVSSNIVQAVVDLSRIGGGTHIPSGVGFVSRETPNIGLSLIPTANNIGISNQLEGRIHTHNMLLIDQAINSGPDQNGIISALPAGNVSIDADTNEFEILDLSRWNMIVPQHGTPWRNRHLMVGRNALLQTFSSSQDSRLEADTAFVRMRYISPALGTRQIMISDSLRILDPSINTPGEVLTVTSVGPSGAVIRSKPAQGDGNGIYGGSGALKLNTTQINYDNTGDNYLKFDNFPNNKSLNLSLYSETQNYDSDAGFNIGTSKGIIGFDAYNRNQLQISQGKRIKTYNDQNLYLYKALGLNEKYGRLRYFLDYGTSEKGGGFLAEIDSADNRLFTHNVISFDNVNNFSSGDKQHAVGFGLGNWTEENYERFKALNPNFYIQTSVRTGFNSHATFDWLRVENIEADTLGDRVKFYNGKYAIPNAAPGPGNRIPQWVNGVAGWIDTPTGGGGGLAGVSRRVPFTNGNTSIIFQNAFRMDTILAANLSKYRLNLNNPTGLGINNPDYVVFSAKSGDATTAEGVFEVSDQDASMSAVGYDPRFVNYRANGTFSAPTNLTNGQTIFTMLGQGHIAGGRQNAGAILLDYTGTGNDVQTAWRFRIDGANEKMVIGSAGVIINDGASNLDLDVAGGARVQKVSGGKTTLFQLDEAAAQVYIQASDAGPNTMHRILADDLGGIEITGGQVTGDQYQAGIKINKDKMEAKAREFASVEAARTGLIGISNEVYTVDGDNVLRVRGEDSDISSEIPTLKATGLTGTSIPFTGNNISSYWNASRLLVFKNGLLLEAGAGNDYTISSYTPLTLTVSTAAVNADKFIVKFIKY